MTAGDKAPTGYDLLKMATRGSARLLGRSDIGELSPGKAADFFAIDTRRIEMLCADRDAADLFGTVGWHLPADLVYVNGRKTVENGRLLTVDEDRLLRDGKAAVARLLEA